MPERFTETMRAASEAGWSHAVQHRFVNELFAGAVPDAVMARYPNLKSPSRAASQRYAQVIDIMLNVGRASGTDRRYGADSTAKTASRLTI